MSGSSRSASRSVVSSGLASATNSTKTSHTATSASTTMSTLRTCAVQHGIWQAGAMATNAVQVEHDGPVTIVTIDRPHARNAVDRPTAQLLADTFRAFDADDDHAVAIL